MKISTSRLRRIIREMLIFEYTPQPGVRLYHRSYRKFKSGDVLTPQVEYDTVYCDAETGSQQADMTIWGSYEGKQFEAVSTFTYFDVSTRARESVVEYAVTALNNVIEELTGNDPDLSDEVVESALGDKVDYILSEFEKDKERYDNPGY